MTRTINAPGIQLNEYDRSNQDSTVDNSVVGTVTTVLGFADKGEDYQVKWINSMNTFYSTYGYPTNDAETYFYNAAYEILNRGGILTTAKLPYMNNSLNQYSYCRYNVAENLTELSSPYDIVSKYIKAKADNVESDKSLFDFLLMPDFHVLTEFFVYNERPNALGIEESLTYDGTASVPIKGEHIIESEDPVIDIFNEEELYLDSVKDLFEYIRNKVNFSFDALNAYDDIFYLDGHIRNEAVYMLFAIMKLDEDTDGDYRAYLIDVYGQQDNQTIFDKYESVIDDIKETLQNDFVHNARTDFEEIVKEFGQKQTIETYRLYYQQILDKLSDFSDENYDIIIDIINAFEKDNKTDALYAKFTEVRVADYNIDTALEITNDDIEKSGLISFDTIDKIKVGEILPPENSIIITDITRSRYQKDDFGNEIIGILPVITTAVNALYYKDKISHNDTNLSDYCPVRYIRNTFVKESSKIAGNSYILDELNNDSDTSKFCGFSSNIGDEQDVLDTDESISKVASEYFPDIRLLETRLELDNLKKIGIVVFKLYKNTSNDNRIGFLPVEAFSGTLNKDEIDITTNKSVFIDTIVNQNSKYINVFSNVKFAKSYESRKNADKAATYIIRNQTATSLGFYSCDTIKNIHVKTSIIDAIKNIFSKIEDKNTLDIDILCDAGVSNIAQFIASTCLTKSNGTGFESNQLQRCGEFNLDSDTAYLYKLSSEESMTVWKKVLQLYDEFAKTTRKDCLFLADMIRPFCLDGELKIVRNTSSANTVKNTILPKLKYITNVINSSYSAGYANWFRQVNHYSGEYFWCPPSIKAAGILLYTDIYSYFWNAPAGLSRGRLPDDVIDIAFNPSNEEAGYIYNANWNYAVSYPGSGIIMEGQKTFQKDKTAFDRINVRRLFLGLEKGVNQIAKYFKYEGITDYLMMRFVDSIRPMFELAKTKSGLQDYAIICDSSNNTTQTIDNNELHCTIAVKPVKVLEYIVLNFIATALGADVNEVATESL